VIVRDDRAVGIETDSGRTIGARAVVSTLNPRQSFLGLIGPDILPNNLRHKVEAWKWDEWSSLSVHFAVKGHPVFSGPEGPLPAALTNIIGYESLDGILSHWERCSRGELPSGEGSWTTTSEVDPNQAPDGLHTVRMETQAPFRLKEGQWESSKKTVAEGCIKKWRLALSNSQELKILKQYPYPPTYLEARLPELSFGSVNEGALVPEQMSCFRPHESCSGSRTPIKGFYVAGKSVSWGGLLILSTARLAANAITEDFGIGKWWPPESRVWLPSDRTD
jgi:phytoene dehydrogenase-like protein